jgi:hypothetical protein
LLYNAEISKQLRQCDAEIILDFKMCGVTTYMLFGFYLFLKQEAAPAFENLQIAGLPKEDFLVMERASS